jgi:hypothetical protein
MQSKCKRVEDAEGNKRAHLQIVTNISKDNDGTSIFAESDDGLSAVN